LRREGTVYRFMLMAVALVTIGTALGCETDLQRQQREAIEAEDKMNADFEAKLGKVEQFAAKADKQKPEDVLQVVEKYEEIRDEARVVDPTLQERALQKGLHVWNDVYIAMARAEYNKALKAANDKVDNSDFDGALAELAKFPEALGKKHTYGKMMDRRKKEIEAWREAPEEAHSILYAAQALMDAKKYEEALKKCDEFFGTDAGKTKSPARNFVLNRHVAIIEAIIDDMVAKGEHEEALKRLKRYAGLYLPHADFLSIKYAEIKKKMEAGK
jgi:hypothetical protein